MTASVTRIHVENTDPLMSSAEVCEYAGISYRQLDYWARAEWIHAANTGPRPGTGASRRFDLAEARVARQCALLISVGFTTIRAIELARKVARTGRDVWLADGLVIVRKDGRP